MKSVKIFRPNSWCLAAFALLFLGLLSSCNSGSSSESSSNPTITAFSINGVAGTISSYGNNGAATDYNITIQLPESTSLGNLTPVFALSENASEVSVNGVLNYSGRSSNNFSQPLIYTVIGSNPSNTTTYTVAVNYGILSANVSESMYYSLTSGLSSPITVTLTGASAANGALLTTRQVYLYGDQLLQGNPVYKLVKLGMANDNPPRIPIGTPIKNVAIAAILLFLPAFLDCNEVTESCTMQGSYYYPPLQYTIPVVP